MNKCRFSFPSAAVDRGIPNAFGEENRIRYNESNPTPHLFFT